MRPAVSNEYIENEEPAAQPTYRVCYPIRDAMADVVQKLVPKCALRGDFDDLPREAGSVVGALSALLRDAKLRANFQSQVL